MKHAPKTRLMVDRCNLGRPFQQWLIAFAQVTDYKSPPSPQLLAMMRKKVKGWASSLINEDANKRLKETVLRESPSQLIKSVRLWLELIDSALLSTYKETDVTIDTCAQPPDNEDFERIFRRTSTNVAKCTIAENLENERIKKWHAEIQKIKTVKFHTFNPGSEPELYAEMVLMRICTANDNWISVPDAWRSGLLPEGCLVERIASEEKFIVEKRCKVAVALWPAKQLQVGLYTKECSDYSLVWAVVFKLEEWRLYPTRYISPLNLFSKDYLSPHHSSHNSKCKTEYLLSVKTSYDIKIAKPATIFLEMISDVWCSLCVHWNSNFVCFILTIEKYTCYFSKLTIVCICRWRVMIL